jgi:hypothetical protein
MKNLKLYAILFISLVSLNSCKDEVEAPGTAYASFESYLGDITVTPGQDLAKSISVFTANVTGADRTIELTLSGTLDASSYTIPTSVTIPANTNEGKIDVVFKDVNLSIIEDKTLSIAMTQTADLIVGRSITLKVAKGCPSGDGKVKTVVALDSYPEEVYWRIRNATTGVVFMTNSATPGYGGYPAGTTGTQRDAACLPAGDYLIQVYDQYGDGAGAMTVSVNGLQVFSTNGVYGAGVSGTFTIN